MNIVHRDLKPENFLFKNNNENAELKIIDFGLAKILDEGREQRMNTRAGTPYFISPEVIDGDYDLSCDMWSAGVLFYMLLCGCPPFYGDTNHEILLMVSRGEFEFNGKEWVNVSDNAKDLIKQLLINPVQRLTASQALQHRWIVRNERKMKVPAPIQMKDSKHT